MKPFAAIAVTALLMTGCQTESVPTPEFHLVEGGAKAQAGLTSVVVTPVAFNTKNAPTAQLHVPDMMCEMACIPAVKEVLVNQAGVLDVKIDFPTRMVTLAVDSNEFDGAATVAALVDYQFDNTKLITSDNEE